MAQTHGCPILAALNWTELANWLPILDLLNVSFKSQVSSCISQYSQGKLGFSLKNIIDSLISFKLLSQLINLNYCFKAIYKAVQQYSLLWVSFEIFWAKIPSKDIMFFSIYICVSMHLFLNIVKQIQHTGDTECLNMCANSSTKKIQKK